MKAAVIYKPGDIQVIEKEIPTPEENEVLIRIKACGVCGTDHSLYTGCFPANYPVVIGHEFSGEVAAIGEEVKSLAVGDRVTVDPNRVCLRCEYCRMGKVHLCENLSSMGVHIDGADAEYCVMSETNVYKIPDTVSFEAAAFTEPLACAVHGLEMAEVQHGDTVLVLGAGGMGNLLTQLCVLAGAAQVIVSEPIAHRREIALQNGATHVLDPLNQDIDKELPMFSGSLAGEIRLARKISQSQVMIEARLIPGPMLQNNEMASQFLDKSRKGPLIISVKGTLERPSVSWRKS